jgi:hypothetical protein
MSINVTAAIWIPKKLTLQQGEFVPPQSNLKKENLYQQNCKIAFSVGNSLFKKMALTILEQVHYTIVYIVHCSICQI